MSVSEDSSGSVHVYTGEGKGKTTAAFGLAMRASGRGKTVLIIQFMKGQSSCGEIIAAKRLAGVEVEQYGRDAYIQPDTATDEDRELARKALDRARRAIKSIEVDMLILDEANVAVHFGLVSVADLLQLIDSKPKNMELVLTGRYAKPEIIEKAEYVTEMLKKKHPFDSGRKARPGVEF